MKCSFINTQESFSNSANFHKLTVHLTITVGVEEISFKVKNIQAKMWFARVAVSLLTRYHSADHKEASHQTRLTYFRRLAHAQHSPHLKCIRVQCQQL